MNTLSARLSLALFAIVVVMGTAFFVVDRANSRLYHEELTQRLNGSIAMYVTDQSQLITDSEPDVAALQELAARAMVINPTAEVYLLDSEGRILGHGMPEGTALEEPVDLAPIRSLIGGADRMPIHGDDPRSAGMRKVFSAAEIRSGEKLEGYLYVVLGGQTYERLANDIGGSYAGNVSLLAAVVIVLVAAATGLLVFALLTRRLTRLSREVERAGEREFEFEPTIRETRAGGDEIDRLTQAFVDMTRRIREQLSQLRENDRLRRELVTNISHDLRTPVSAMQGSIETMIVKGESLSETDRRRYLDIARRHMVRLGVLISDLFELSKLDSASVTPSLEVFSIPELVQDIAQEFQLEAENKGIRLSMAADDNTVFTVGDIGLIQRVLENLVRNAIRFTPQGGDVTLSISERTEAVTVAVSDTGPGIPQDEIPRIFDRFYRSERGDEALSDSSGLGLAIVKRILDLHDSRISVVSRVDAGTRFEFDLPRYDRAA